MSKIEFKEFVKKNPHLINQVESGNTNWQKLYELYDLYGESNEVWNKYQTNDTRNSNNTSNQQTNPLNFGNNIKDILNMVKGIDLNTVQKGLNSLDKAIEAFKGIIPDKTSNLTDTYEPRPTYKYFED